MVTVGVVKGVDVYVVSVVGTGVLAVVGDSVVNVVGIFVVSVPNAILHAITEQDRVVCSFNLPPRFRRHQFIRLMYCTINSEIGEYDSTT